MQDGEGAGEHRDKMLWQDLHEECPIREGVQGRVGQVLEQPALLKGAAAHGRAEL